MIYASINDRELIRQLDRLKELFPQETREAVYNTALVSIETYMKRNDIPVDTGRLRASINTKSVRKELHRYEDNDGQAFDGTLSPSVDLDHVVVGTNVEYAEYINKNGGGGPFSNREVDGMKRPKGYGKGFFDKAVRNGEIQLEKRLRRLINDMEDLV